MMLEKFPLVADALQDHWRRARMNGDWKPTLQYLNGAVGVFCGLHDSDYYQEAIDEIYILRRVIHRRDKTPEKRSH